MMYADGTKLWPTLLLRYDEIFHFKRTSTFFFAFSFFLHILMTQSATVDRILEVLRDTSISISSMRNRAYMHKFLPHLIYTVVVHKPSHDGYHLFTVFVQGSRSSEAIKKQFIDLLFKQSFKLPSVQDLR